MAKVYSRGPHAHTTRVVGAITRARKPQKVVTAKKLREQKARTEQVKESRAMRKMLREKPKLRGWLHLIAFPFSPKLRGWLHLIAFPFSVATSVLLIVLAPSGWMKVGVSVYGATIMLLFGVSAALHLGHGHFPRLVDEMLCRIDYSNIFLVIAGTCTPFLFALDNWPVCWTYIGIVWITAIVGTLVHLVYPVGLDWLFTIVYIVLGLAPITIIHLFWKFLVIAGTCTPFLFALDNWPVCWTYIGIVWITAIVGTLVHLVYPVGLDWLFTIVYIVLGLAPITIIHLFWKSPYIGPVPTILVIAGGACYIAGAVCFALRKPNPVPKWFGFHELFHLGTIGGYVCHVIALFMTVLAMR